MLGTDSESTHITISIIAPALVFIRMFILGTRVDPVLKCFWVSAFEVFRLNTRSITADMFKFRGANNLTRGEGSGAGHLEFGVTNLFLIFPFVA